MSSRLVVAESPPTNIFFVRITCVKTFRSLGNEFEDGNYQFGVGLPRHGNLWFYQLPVQLMGWIVQHLNWQKLQYLKTCKMIYLSHTGGLSKCDESESARPPRGRVLHHHHLGHVPELGEVLPHILRGGLPREAAYEHLAGVIGNLIQINRSESREQTCNNVKLRHRNICNSETSI